MTATATQTQMAARDAEMSERTFFRHKAAGKAIPKPQHRAHVEAFEQSLSSMARLDYRSQRRRCALLSPLPWTAAHLAPIAEAGA